MMRFKLPTIKLPRLSLKLVALVLGLLLLAGQTAFIVYTLGRLRPMMSSVLREEGLERMRRNLELLNQDSRELRQALKLPPIAYPEPESRVADATGQTGGERASPALPFFRGVERLVQIQAENSLMRDMNELMSSIWIAALLKTEKLIAENRPAGQPWQRLSKNGKPYFRLSMDAASGKPVLESGRGKRFILNTAGDSAIQTGIKNEIRAIDEHLAAFDTALSGIHSLLSSAEITAVCAEQGLVYGPAQDGELSHAVPFYLRRQRTSPRLLLELARRDLRISAGGETFADLRELARRLPGLLRALDTHSDAELLAEKKKTELLGITADPGLKAYLESRKLVFGASFREDSEYWYLDVLDAAGKRVGSFGLQKSSGEIYLMDHEDVPLSSIRRLQPAPAGPKKKVDLPATVPQIRDLYKKNAERVFLIVGAHEKMTDSIILAHVAEQKGRVTLISLPRDLYYHQKKLNSLYLRFGAERFVREVAEITGLAIDRFVIIDMYAFIDAIDIIGGIDISFEEDIIDPTYRVRNGGVWSTLYYARGRHHLSGLEALRVARSRHFASDFGRARRQQDIIKAVKEKFDTLGPGDLDKIFALIQTLSEFVETDMPPVEGVSYIMRYLSARVTKQLVLDVNNVLYATYENLIGLPDQTAAEDEQFDKGAYVLQPVNDDWNLLRWFIRSEIEENV
jgi:LCP family protein required for cell wall assembly